MIPPGFSDRRELEAHQRGALRRLVATLMASNRFYGPMLEQAGIDPASLELAQFTQRMPLTTKAQISEDQRRHPPYGTNLTYPLDRYCRFSQTSGTTGQPIRWLDTAESWQWMCDNWRQVLAATGARRGDRVLCAFSFGPFLGFWTAFEAALQAEMMVIPGGGMSSAARLQTLIDNDVTILCCTPTYALRLAETAASKRIDLGQSRVRVIVVAGEPGGSSPAVRGRIERHWPGACVFDHHGMTEIGPVSYGNPDRPDLLHVIESSYLAEILDADGRPVPPGTPGELVLTTLGRTGSPLLRYRTGDLVRRSTLGADALNRVDMALEGGILGRCDDMVLVRGVNVYPGAVDEIVRRFDAVSEYQVRVRAQSGMTELELVVEPSAGHGDADALCGAVSEALRDVLQLRVPVTAAAPETLPRFEMKARRWIRS
ncbi:MAG: phenylacetate--CoA ligase [Phycisphaeraceae bacterium]|nr:phenylacetate--CoA ligase [Phycisphaeraceae bacterium]